MRYGSLNYKTSTEEGNVTTTKEFKELPWVIQADILQDWRHDIDKLYSEALDIPRKLYKPAINGQ